DAIPPATDSAPSIYSPLQFCTRVWAGMRTHFLRAHIPAAKISTHEHTNKRQVDLRQNIYLIPPVFTGAIYLRAFSAYTPGCPDSVHFPGDHRPPLWMT